MNHELEVIDLQCELIRFMVNIKSRGTNKIKHINFCIEVHSIAIQIKNKTMNKTITFHFHFSAIFILCLLTNFAFSQNKTAPAFNMDAAGKAIQLQIRAFENELKKGDAVALGKLYCTDAKLMNNGNPSTIGRANIVEDFAGYKLKRIYDLKAPKGVMGRNSENTLIRKYLGWEPSIPLREGMKKTYDWISEQLTGTNKTKKENSRFNR